MSQIKSPLNENEIDPFDENLFSREDDLLNVFKSTVKKESLDADNKIPEFELMEASSYTQNKFSLFNYSSPEEKHLGGSKNYYKLEGYLKEEHLDDSLAPMNITCTKSKLEINDSRGNSSVAFSHASFLFSDIDNSKVVDSYFSNPVKSLSDFQDTPEGINNQSTKKEKLFSKRKDVIIKTLLRKSKKFFLKDFNTKTSYLRTAKRKFGSSVYRSSLETYITKTLQIPLTEDMLIFLGVFLYQKDLEDNLDLFVSLNYSPLDIKSLATTVHEILYKYSHKKFHNFSKNKEFKFLFTYFEKFGMDELKGDALAQEYTLGLEIIRGQL